MNNQFFNMEFWRGLIYTVIGVFAGAALTWIVSTEIESHKAAKEELQRFESLQKDKQQYLELLRVELQQNLENVQKQEKYYKPDSKELPNYFGYEKAAFEMFQNSGTMTLIQNRELLSSVWKIYTHLEQLKAINASFIQSHMDKDWHDMDAESTGKSFHTVDNKMQQVLSDYNKLQ
jgi:hypothetical protein